LFKSYCDVLEPLKNIFNQIKYMYNLNDDSNYKATGNLLDILGQIVDMPRSGRNDADYRNALNVKMVVNRSYGDSPALMLLTKLLTDATFVCHRECYPSSVYYTLHTPDNVGNNVYLDMNSVKLGGVKLGVQYSKNDKKMLAFQPTGGFNQLPNAGWFYFGSGDTKNCGALTINISN
jgi:hypothetical protein